MMRRALVLLILVSTIPFAALAQAPEIGRIALYADSFRTTSEVDLPAPYTAFDLYIFCLPSENGMYCAEFALRSSTESMVIAGSNWHPGLSVVMGDMATGVSACFLECQTDWVCINRATMLNSNIEPATIDIVRHPDVGYYQFASCLPDSPIEPIFIGPNLCVNSSCTPDTDPPVPVSIDVEDDMRLTLFFDEKIFEPDAVDPGSYIIHRTDGPLYTIPVNFAQLQGEEDRVWMVLGGHLGDASYTLEIMGLRDIAGNPSLPGTGISFGGEDTTPPELLYAYAPDDYTAVLVFSETLDLGSVEDISNYTIGCDECLIVPQPVSATLRPDGRSVALSLDPSMEQVWIYEVTVEGIADISGNVMAAPAAVSFKAPDTTPPYISEVVFTADTSLAILWNETLDPVSAVDLANYSFFSDGPPAEPMTLISAKLSSGIRVRLDFEPAIEAEGEYTLFVGGVMDTSMNVMYPDTFHVVPLDTIPPALLSAECMGLLVVDLTFSEPVDTRSWGLTSHFQLYPLGSPEAILTIEDFSVFSEDTVIRLHLAEELTPGAVYTIRANDIRDFAGNTIPSQYLDFTCYDIYPPEVVEIFLPDLTHVNIQFDEVVNAAAAEVASYLIYEAVDSTTVADVSSAALFEGGTRALLTMAAPLGLGEIYTLKMNGIGDLLGNMLDPDTSWSFIAEDTVDPVLLGLTVTSDSLIHLEFNEPLDPVTAEDITKYAVVEAGDTSVKLPLQSATLDPAGTIVDLEIDGRGGIGTSYVIWIIGMTDIAGNALYAVSGDFQFIDDIPPSLLSAVGATSRNVIVFFDEAITSATASEEHNYTLYPTGDPISEVAIFQASRLTDQKSANLVLGEDLVQDTDYTLEVTGIMDLAGYTMDPASVEFHFLDVNPPVILNVDLVNPTRLAIEFNEPVDSVTATDTSNYSVYLTANSSQQIAATSIDWMTDEVRLNLAAEPTANANYTVRIDGVEDRFGNACSELYGSFRYDVYAPSAKLYLYADEYRNSQKVDVGLYCGFCIYVWIEPGGNGVFAVEYALSTPATYAMLDLTLNPVYVSTALGDPYSGHSVALSMCTHDWFWAARIDCICITPDQQEIVWPRPYPDVGVIQVASCLPGHPLEPVVATYPLLINAVYIGTLLDSWDVSFRSGGVELNWSILDSGNVPEFEVSRTEEGVEAWRQLDGGLIRGDGLRYTMLDSDLEFGQSYRYRVEVIEKDGRKVLFETDAVATPVMPLTLRQNSPNPFNPSTSIGFFLPRAGNVRIEIFDVNGRQINVLADRHYTSGEHSVDWNGRDRTGSMVTSGVYFYRLIAGKESLSRKMVLLR